MDLKALEQVYDNYKTMSNLGFLDQRILSSNLGRILNVPAVVNRPGRPVTIPLSYEDMLNVESWDDSKLVFKKVNMQGMDYFLGGLGDYPMAPEGEQGANVAAQQQSKKGYADGNSNECGICSGYGKLICCDARGHK